MQAAFAKLDRGVAVHARCITASEVVGLLSGLAAAAVVPFPFIESIPFLLAAATVHYLYCALMLNAYSVGDMSQVYPFARDIAPLLVAVLVALLVGKFLGPLSFLAVFVLSAGVFLLAQSGDTVNRKAVAFAFLTGVTIAGYSFLRDFGIRKSQSLLNYIAWLGIATEVGMASVAYVRRKLVLVEFVRKQLRSGLIAGLLSVTGYAIALWVMSVLAMAPIVALRETGVVFAAIIGSAFLGEGFAGRRVTAAAVVVAGIVLLSVRSNAA